jgi:hypothetical protein
MPRIWTQKPRWTLLQNKFSSGSGLSPGTAAGVLRTTSLWSFCLDMCIGPGKFTNSGPYLSIPTAECPLPQFPIPLFCKSREIYIALLSLCSAVIPSKFNRKTPCHK